jgi:hypothetical protein
MRVPYMLCATLTTVALLAAPGCSKIVSGTAARDTHVPKPKPSDCEPVSAPLTAIDSRADGEPQLKIPQPPGWERASMLDSDVIRFTMRNKDLVSEHFMPTAVVTLESVSGDTDTKTVFEQERGALVDRLGATGLHTMETTRCGDDAEIVDYDAPSMGNIPPRKVKTLMVAAAYNDNTYVTTVTVQSTDPDNATYTRDTGMVLAGFQMLPPAAS